jgi:Icc-related predicted phosphoesterase
MKIALFSDVHGRLRVILHMIRNWQMVHKCYLDGALIAGDLGCFPNITKVDKATRRWMDGDPEEAGFSKFFVQPRPDVENMFLPEYGEFSDIRCPIHFVPGNHEDFDFLNALKKANGQQTFPVDCYRRFNCIQDGAVIPICGEDGNCLRVAGIWGIENTIPRAPYKINPASIRQLESLGEKQFDLLLTHDAPAGAYPDGGSKLITLIIKACQPEIHLFGHVHPPLGRHQYYTQGARTRSFILKDVSFGKTKCENLSGSLGLLDWDGSSTRVCMVTDDWLKQMHYQTWEQVWPEVAIA